MSYLILAALLTVLDGILTVCFSKTIEFACAGDLPARELLILVAALGATSLAKVWFWPAPVAGARDSWPVTRSSMQYQVSF